MLPEATSRHYHYVLWIKVVAEGAVIKVDFVEGLGGESDHLALVEAAILMLANDLLASRDAQQGSFSALGGTAWVSLDCTDSSSKLPYGAWGEISVEKERWRQMEGRTGLSRHLHSSQGYVSSINHSPEL